MSGIMAHSGLLLSGLRFSDGDYGFIPDGNNTNLLTFSDNGRTIASLTNTNNPSHTRSISNKASAYGKYCLEFVINNVGVLSADVRVGIVEHSASYSTYSNGFILKDDGNLVRYSDNLGSTVVNSSGGVYQFTTGDVIGFYCDFETGTVEIAKNGTTIHTDTGFYKRNKFALLGGHADLMPTTSGPAKPSVSIVDGGKGFNYPRAGYKPWSPYKSKVAFNPAKTETGVSIIGDGTAVYNNTGTTQVLFSVVNKGYSTGKHVFYMSKIGSTVDTSSRIGIVSDSFDPFTATNLGASGAGNVSSVGMSMAYGANSITVYSNFDGVTSSTTYSQLSNGSIEDFITIAVDLDSAQKTCKFYNRGTLTHTVNLPNGKTWYPAVQLSDERITTLLNFGQVTPLYPIAGYKNWDESLPASNTKEDPYSEYVHNMHTFDSTGQLNKDKRGMDWNLTGNPVRDTGIKKFGDGSLSLNSASTNQYLHPSRDIFISPQKTATIELWVRPSTISHPTDATVVFVGNLSSSTSGFRLKWKNQSFFRLEANNGTDFAALDSGAISPDTWYFVQIIRDENLLKLCVDGTLIGQVTYSASITHSVYFGTGSASSSSDVTTAFKGHLDDIRITRFIARSPALPTESLSKY